MKDSITLPFYMQIFGYLTTLTYRFEEVPVEYVGELVQSTVTEWLNEDFTKIGFYFTN